MTQHASYIKSVVDKVLTPSQSEFAFQAPDVLVPEYMLDQTRSSPFEGIVYWKPVPTDITEATFQAFETSLGYELPETYKQFLSYRYFIELNFKHDAIFFRHTASWTKDYFDTLSQTEFSETVGSGYIPFANINDQGYFCFDASWQVPDNEYPIVQYDQAFGISEYISGCCKNVTFLEFMKELDASLG